MSYQDLDAYFRNYLAANTKLFGEKSNEVDLLLSRVAEESINGIPRTSLSYEQYVLGRRVNEGEIVASFANNILVAVHGVLLSDDEIGDAPRKKTSVAASRCDSQETEEVYSREFGELVQLSRCADVTQMLDLATGDVLLSTTVVEEWTPSANYVNSIVTPPYTGSWFGTNPTPITTHILEAVVSCPQGGSCNTPRRDVFLPLDYNPGPTWQLSYGNGMSPYPLMRDSGLLTIAASSFTDATSYTTAIRALAQVAYERIAGVAGYVASSSTAGLWGFRYPGNNGGLTVNVYNAPETQCCSAPGCFSPGSRQICLNFGRNSGFDWSSTPLHEYGHYIHTSYGMNGSSCLEQATDEGFADAMAISLEWLRQAPVPGDLRFRTSVGVSSGGYDATTAGGYNSIVRLSDWSCSTGNNKYTMGMSISQVFWALLNNEYCDALSGSSCVYRTVLPGMSYSQSAQIARQTLTVTVDDTGSSAAIGDFLREWWYNLYYSVSWPAVWQLRQLFLQHSVSLPRQFPRGNFDSVTPNYVGPGMSYTFSGWACDPDTPANPERQDVHIYVQGVGIAAIVASQASEPAVADACADPTYSNHRFSYTISNAALRSLVGSGSKNVQLYAIDSDFDGAYNIALGGPASVFVFASY